MRTQRWFWSGISLVCVLAMLASSCGGGSTTGVPGPGPIDPPIGGNQYPKTNSPDGPQAQQIQGASSGASLGTNPAYNVQQVPNVPVDVTPASASRATSALDATQTFKITAATVTAANITNPALVNFSAPTLQFNEGTSVNLWIQYEVKAGASFNWNWKVVSNSTTTLLNYSADRTETTAGIKTFYMTLLLPLDDKTSIDKPAVFSCEFKTKVANSVIIIDEGNKATVDFLIKDVPVIVLNYGNQGGAYMAWEDLLVNSDYDYNDFVGGLYAKELRRSSDGKVVQINFTVKAVARGAGYDSDWQFNMDSAFPGATCTAYVQRYAANGTPKGSLTTWTSAQGVSIPIFTSNSTTSLPVGPNGDGFSTNVKKGSTFVDGDYASVTILFNNPLTPGTFTPIPYKPQLRVKASDTNIYIIGLWSRRGDPVDSNGRPLGFVVPGSFAWMMEGREITNGYPRFTTFKNWLSTGKVGSTTVPDDVLTPIGNNADGTPIYKSGYTLINWWDDAPVKSTGSGSSTTYNTYQTSLFGGSPKAMPIPFPKPT